MGMIKKRQLSKVLKNYELYILLLPALAFVLIFEYGPMYGIQIAFKNFMAVKGVGGSPWVGFVNFERFFNSYQFWLLIRNTIGLSLYQMVAGFPVPIVLALMINQVNNVRFKKSVQTITYAPHFISVVVLVGIVYIFLSPGSGLVNHLIVFFGGEPIQFLAKPEWFQSIYVLSSLWKEAGWGTIIYLAALTAISPDLHEAAVMDGASKLRRIWHIDLPGIMQTIVIMLILKAGQLMSVGFEMAYLLQNYLNADKSEIIATYVYKIGLLDAQYSYSAAIGLFNSVINCVLLISVNYAAKRLGQSSLW